MKNKEKYVKEIVDLALSCKGIAVNKETNEPCACDDTDCDICVAKGGNCKELIKKWAKKEYEEPKVDWSKVAVDTPIYVRNNEYGEWIKKHFAKYDSEMVYAFDCGRTSFTCGREDSVFPWKFAKLAKVGKETE